MSADDGKTTIKPRSSSPAPVDQKTRFQANNRTANKHVASQQQDGQLTAPTSSQKSLADEQKTRYKPRKSTAAQPADDALTRIGEAIRSHRDNSQGFIKAKKAADKALANNKIVLNNRFVLESTLGAGGMGTVYKAKDLRKVEAEDLNPYIAVKVLSDDFKDHPDAFVSLQREASRSHLLSHPNIVNVHDFDRDGDSIYMTMELLNGQGLDTVLNQHRTTGLAKEEALKIIAEFCSALSYAHNKDIVHSDLKPGNLFIDKSGAKVLDFGIARIANDSYNEKDFDAGSLGALTPAYASLEMLERQPPHPADDVYAAAIIAYELLCGKHPYDRLPADQALQKGLKPNRIEGLSKQQWNALEAALKLRRKDRTSNIDEFVNNLTNKKRFPIFKISSALSAVVIMGFVYQYYFAPDELSSIIDSTMNNAESCYQGQDYSCAIEAARSVLNMDPDHSSAKQLLNQAEAQYQKAHITAIYSRIDDCLKSEKSITCAEAELINMRKLTPEKHWLEKAESTINQFQIEQDINNKLIQAESCLISNTLDCAISYSEQILELDAAHEQALSILQQAQIHKEQQQLEEQKQKQKLEQLFTQADNCFKQKNYPCSIEHAKQILRIQPNNSTAEALYQKALFAQVQDEKNREKAQAVLEKGQACFRKKNYSCAQSNAESALAFMPGYTPAIELRENAISALEKVKRDWSIE